MEKVTHYLDVRLAVNFHETLKPSVVEGFKMALGVSSEEAIFGAYAKMIVNEIESDIVKKRFDHLVLVDAELSAIDYDADLKVEEENLVIEEPAHDYPDEYPDYDEYVEYINELANDSEDYIYMTEKVEPDKARDLDTYNLDAILSESKASIPLELEDVIQDTVEEGFTEEKENFWGLLDEITEELFDIRSYRGTDIEVFLDKDLHGKYGEQIKRELIDYTGAVQAINEFDYPFANADDNYKYIISYIDARDEVKHVYKKIEDTTKGE